MTTPNDGGPAFPHPEMVQDILDENGHVKSHRCFHAMPGMSLRDYFAGQALQGILRAEDGWDGEPYVGSRRCEVYAKESYGLADAMLAERQPK